MVTKKAYEKPLLRKVRLEVKTSVLSTCHTSLDQTPNMEPLGGPCNSPVTNCFYPQ